MARQLAVALLSLSALVRPSHSIEWDGSDLPNPLQADGYARCGYDSASRVCDPDKLLSFGGDTQREAIEWMNAQLDDVENELRNRTVFYARDGNARCAGAERPVRFYAVVVYDIAKVNPKSAAHSTDLVAFAKRAASHYALDDADGGGGCNNWVLITCATQPRIIYVEHGEHIPPSDTYWSQKIQDRFLKDDDIPGGVVLIAKKHRDTMLDGGRYRNATSSASASVATAGAPEYWHWLLWLIVIIAIVLLLVCGLLICFTYTACYHKKRTGKWRLIPIGVKRISEPGKPVYPEFTTGSKTLDLPATYPPHAYLQDYGYGTGGPHGGGSTSDMMHDSGTASPSSPDSYKHAAGAYANGAAQRGNGHDELTPSPRGDAMVDADTVSTASEPGYAAPTKADARTATLMSSRHQSPA